jgi:hypothetical protein
MRVATTATASSPQSVAITSVLLRVPGEGLEPHAVLDGQRV